MLVYGKKDQELEKIKIEVYPESCILKANPEKDKLNLKEKKSGFFSRAKQKDLYFLNSVDLKDFLANFEEIKAASIK